MMKHRTLAPVLVAAFVTASLATPAVALARFDDATLLRDRTTLAAHTTAVAAAQAAGVTDRSADAQLAADLAFMREEEKLAHDVYVLLGEKWDLRVFSNIAVSEQRHTDSIAALLEAYGVADPTSGLGAGEYKSDELQKLYDSLVAKGSVSAQGALEVGKLIEVTDIKDLEARIARTDEADVLAVYQNLLNASRNHQSAFERQLSGETGGGMGRGAGAAGGGRGMGRGAAAGN